MDWIRSLAAHAVGPAAGRWKRALACAGGTTVLMSALFLSGALQSMERHTLDLRFQYANRPALVDSSIVLATIDEGSLSFFRGEGRRVGWPWPRDFYGALVEYLDRGGARAVVFDMLFAESDLLRPTSSDQRFADALEAAGTVALAAQMTPSDTMKNALNPMHRLDRRLPAHVRVPPYPGVLAPLPAFQEGAAAVGAVNMAADADGVVRRIPLAFRTDEGLQLPSLGGAALQADNENNRSLEELAGEGLGPDGAFLLYWYGPGGVDGVFEEQYVSIRALIVSAARMQMGREPIVPPERFAGKTVIVGGTAAGLFDKHSTPVGVAGAKGRHGAYPGMEIFATFLSNVQQGHRLRSPPIWGGLFLIFLMAGMGAVLVAVGRNRVGVAALGVGTVVGLYVVGAGAAFYYGRWWLPIVAPAFSAVAAFSATSAVNYGVEERRRRKIRSLFQHYVSPRVVEEVVQNPEALELGGEEVEGTVFFSDIEGFTSVAEQLSPPALVQHLNEYFGVATEAVLDHRAMVDKYIGDAIMAVFGTPVRQPDHAVQACLAALEMEAAVEAHYAAGNEDGPPPFRSRIGIHTGHIVVGNIGTKRRADYTAIGDAVNVAARLEGANKLYGTRIIISEATYDEASSAVAVRELDRLRVPGKEKPIRIYEVMDRAGALSEDAQQRKTAFERALSLYRDQRWTEAEVAFDEILDRWPEDGPAIRYRTRAREREGTTLPADWNGVHDMEK